MRLSTTVVIREGVARLGAMPASVQAMLEAAVRRLAIRLQGYVISQKLHGQVLHQRSGRLAGSIQQEAPIQEGGGVYGRVFSAGTVKYARIHEFGFTGAVNVPAHQRTMVFGKTVPAFMVKPYTRRVDLPERSFLRSSLADLTGDIEHDLKAAVVEGLRKAAA